MKKLTMVLLALLLVGCTLINLDDILDDIVITPTSVGVITITSTPTVTPVIITATQLPPTATITLTPTPEGFIPSPTPIVDFSDGCEWGEEAVSCQADVCNIRTEPLPGEEYVAYNVPRNTQKSSFAVCELGNERWYYLGVDASNNTLWANSLIWR